MPTWHTILGIALLIYIAFVIYEIRQGGLKGRNRLFAFVAIGCFGLAWIATAFGW